MKRISTNVVTTPVQVSQQPAVRMPLKHYIDILRTKEEELSEALSPQKKASVRITEKHADSTDQVMANQAYELELRDMDRITNLLKMVRAALDRARNGEFGVCIHCENDIAPVRLRAVPWAAYCLTCQDEADRAPTKEDYEMDLGASA